MSLETGIERFGIVVASLISCSTYVGVFRNEYPTVLFYNGSINYAIVITLVISFISSLICFFAIYGMFKGIAWIIKGFKK